MTILSAIDWGWPEMLWTTLISICLVFGILVLLVWIMKLFGMIFVSRRKAAAQGQLHEEEIAAIATALKIFNSDRHDRESDVLTIMSIKRAYSPWNSKIHGLTQMPDKK